MRQNDVLLAKPINRSPNGKTSVGDENKAKQIQLKTNKEEWNSGVLIRKTVSVSDSGPIQTLVIHPIPSSVLGKHLQKLYKQEEQFVESFLGI